MEKFEIILNNYINGNRSDAKKMVKEFSENELDQFKDWLKEIYHEERDKRSLFDFVVFLLG